MGERHRTAVDRTGDRALRAGPPTPSRIGLLTIALLTLSTALLAVSVRYPDEEFGLTIAQANAINDETRAGRGSSFAPCFAQAADPDRPCAVAHLHNFVQRARILGVAVVIAAAVIFLAFAHRYDRRRPEHAPIDG